MLRKFLLQASGLVWLLSAACCSRPEMAKTLACDLETSGAQLKAMAAAYYDNSTTFPRSWAEGEYLDKPYSDWTCGFFPGSLWLFYEMSGKEEYASLARHYTEKVKEAPFYTHTHDLGFMVMNSYGKQYASDKDSTAKAAVIQASKSLAARFDPQIGAIRSWDFGAWNYPVIIDNMMNLEMLFVASELTGDPHFREIAIKHADTTLENHFRDDASSWHVVSYNDDGSVESKGTFQGYGPNSRWARGQAWGLYGYTLCHRFTAEERYLAQAQRIAEMIMQDVKTEDAIPYWDYDAPGIPAESRDASAAAITASALLELQGMVGAEDSRRYQDYAKKILSSLSGPVYLAKPSENGCFILKHSTGAAPFASEIDVPLNYADYYFLEAIQRYAALQKIDTKTLIN